MTAATLIHEKRKSGRPIGARTLAIEAYLQEHYPCQAIPRGTLTEVGAVFGVTRERVRQIANKADFGRLYHLPKPPRPCLNCGQPASPGTPLCEECRWVTLACTACGELFKRARHDVLAGAGAPGG